MVLNLPLVEHAFTTTPCAIALSMSSPSHPPPSTQRQASDEVTSGHLTSSGSLPPATKPTIPPPSSYAQLIESHFSETIEVTPRELQGMAESLSLRELRWDGVQLLKQAIQKSGWTNTPLLAVDREDDSGLHLLEGAHRARALQMLFDDEETSWLLRGQTPETFRVKVSVLKGLTTAEEQQISREANRINSTVVEMSLVDQVYAMMQALHDCQGRLGRGQRVHLKDLHRLHPDYRNYSESSVRTWKRLAEAFGKEAMAYMKRVHSDLDGKFTDDRAQRAFSKKTLLESNALKILNSRGLHGAQLWYLKRVVQLEEKNQVQSLNAKYFQDLAKLMRRIATLCEDFVDVIRELELFRFGRALQTFIITGTPPAKSGEQAQFVKRLHVACLEKFLEKRILSGQWDKVWDVTEDDEEVPCFPYFFKNLLLKAEFEGDRRRMHHHIRIHNCRIIYAERPGRSAPSSTPPPSEPSDYSKDPLWSVSDAEEEGRPPKKKRKKKKKTSSKTKGKQSLPARRETAGVDQEETGTPEEAQPAKEKPRQDNQEETGTAEQAQPAKEKPRQDNQEETGTAEQAQPAKGKPRQDTQEETGTAEQAQPAKETQAQPAVKYEARLSFELSRSYSPPDIEKILTNALKDQGIHLKELTLNVQENG